MKRKRIFALLLAASLMALLPLSLSGCGSTTTTQTSAGSSAAPASAAAASASAAPASAAAGSFIGKTLTVAIDNEPKSLISQTSMASFGTAHILNCMYNYLYENDASGKYVPSLATSSEWVDGTHLRLKLRQGVLFSDGTELTADDIIYSWQAGLQGTAATQYGSPYAPDKFVAEDKYTVVLAFDKPYPFAADELFDTSFPIICKKAVEAQGGLTTAALKPNCGSGRYVLSEWVPGQYIKLKYNEKYWDKSYVPSFEFIKFTFVPDLASRCLAVKSGQADLASLLSRADTLSYANDSAVKVNAISAAATGGAALWYRCDTGPFSDPNVRQAVSYLIDWKACAKVFTGTGDTVMQGWFNKDSAYYAGADKRTFDLAKGKELLSKSAYPNGFSFDLKIEPNSGYQAVAELIQAYLLKANIKANLVNIEMANYMTMFAKDDYVAYVAGAASTPLRFALNYMDATQHMGGARIATPELTSYLNVIKTSMDEAKRTEAIRGMQDYAMKNALMQGITSLMNYTLTSVKVTGIVADNHGWPLVYFIKSA